MIRITELSLPLDTDHPALRRAIVRRLKINDADLLDFTVFKRSYDARKKNSAIVFVYVIDLQARNEPAILQAFADHADFFAGLAGGGAGEADETKTRYKKRDPRQHSKYLSLPCDIQI